MSDADLMQLYSRQILALAADIPHLTPITNPSGSAMVRSPQCGSSLTATLRMEGDRVAAFSQNVRACALGQASASVLGRGVIGASRAEIARGAAELRAMLKEGAPPPGAPWEALEALSAARDYPNRHASILLAWDATLAAIDQAKAG